MKPNDKHKSWMEGLIHPEDTSSTAREFDPVELSLFCRGDSELEEYVLDRFMAEAPLVLKDMRQALERGNGDLVLSKAHALRGACQMLGAYPLAQTCLRFELHHDDLVGIGPSLLQEAGEQLESLCVELQRFLDSRAA